MFSSLRNPWSNWSKEKAKTSTRKFFPGYILVHMELDDQTWHVVKSTPKVTGFIGSRHRTCCDPGRGR